MLLVYLNGRVHCMLYASQVDGWAQSWGLVLQSKTERTRYYTCHGETARRIQMGLPAHRKPKLQLFKGGLYDALTGRGQ